VNLKGQRLAIVVVALSATLVLIGGLLLVGALIGRP
jgi:hypothetical protein